MRNDFMSFMKSAIFAVAAASIPAWASAATIDIEAAGYELAASADKQVTITADGFGFDGASLTGVDLFAFDGTTVSGFSSFDVTSAAQYSVAFSSDSFGTDLASSTAGADVALMDGSISVLFESFTGSGVFAGVDALLVTYTNANLTLNATGSFDTFFDAQGDVSTLRVQGLSDIAPVPLPAGLPLLIGGLACFGFMRRKRAA